MSLKRSLMSSSVVFGLRCDASVKMRVSVNESFSDSRSWSNGVGVAAAV